MPLGLAALTLLLASCTAEAPETLSGYVEAETVRVAAPQAGRLLQLPIARGASARAGELLFVLEQESERAAVEEAEARLKRSQALAADLDKGRRQDELAALTAQRAVVVAQWRQSDAELVRQRRLAAAGFVSTASLDAAQARRDADQARLADLDAQLRLAGQGAREDQRLAARQESEAGAAALAQSRWRLGQKTVTAPLAARVEETYYRVGEWVPAGAPVLSLLAADGVKVRFFVPQARLGEFARGQRVELRCDGCPQAVTAVVDYVAREAEFTPPVIYSRDQRARLVFLVEARPVTAQDAASLRPGQPVEVARLVGA
ncbi:HlyD family secretion protein [Chitinimonas lacunae]|uniref:HlyD family secretion protein n=1 Tax=Chitinimonas lacunae TaxID=1963018 RepID=A0ABV8MKV2_9NEIS